MSGRSGGSSYGADDDGGVLGNVQEMVMGAVALMVLYCGWRFINSPTANLLGKTVNGAANTLQWSLSSPFALILSLILVAAGYVALQIGRFQLERYKTKLQSKDETDAKVDLETKLAGATGARGTTQGNGEGVERNGDGRTKQPRAIRQMNSFDPCSKLGEDASEIIKKDPKLKDLMQRHPKIDVDLLATYYDALSLDGKTTFSYKDDTTFKLKMQLVNHNPKKEKYQTLTNFMKDLEPEDEKLLAKLANVYMQSSIGGIESAYDKSEEDIKSLRDIYEALPEDVRDRELRKLLISAHKGNVPKSLKGVKLPASGGKAKTLGMFRREGITKIEDIMKTMRTPAEVEPEGRSNGLAGLNSNVSTAVGDARRGSRGDASLEEELRRV